MIEAPSWAQPILSYLVSGEVFMDEVAARKVQCRAPANTIINHELIKRSVSGVFQHCVEQDKGRRLLEDIHQGECVHHASSRAIMAKAFLHGFSWPTALEDAKQMVCTCNNC